MNVLEFLTERANVVPRFNRRIQTSENRFLDLLGDSKSGKNSFPGSFNLNYRYDFAI